MRLLALLPIILLISSCSSRQSLFVVLPNPDGSTGAVTIDDGQKSVELDKAYAAEEVRAGVAKPVKVDQAEVQEIFGKALSAQPILPSHFVLYFEKDSNTLTPNSQRQYLSVFEDIKASAGLPDRSNRAYRHSWHSGTQSTAINDARRNGSRPSGKRRDQSRLHLSCWPRAIGSRYQDWRPGGRTAKSSRRDNRSLTSPTQPSHR
jgi:hypothetical protein